MCVCVLFNKELSRLELISMIFLRGSTCESGSTLPSYHSVQAFLFSESQNPGIIACFRSNPGIELLEREQIGLYNLFLRMFPPITQVSAKARSIETMEHKGAAWNTGPQTGAAAVSEMEPISRIHESCKGQSGCAVEWEGSRFGCKF